MNTDLMRGLAGGPLTQWVRRGRFLTLPPMATSTGVAVLTVVRDPAVQGNSSGGNGLTLKRPKGRAPGAVCGCAYEAGERLYGARSAGSLGN